MLLVYAEHNGLLKPIAAFLQELRDLSRHKLGAVVDYQCVVEILSVVKTIFDLYSVTVGLAGFGPVAFDVHIDVDLDDLIRREESVLNALLQGIRIDRLTEIVDVGDVFGLLGSSGESDLRCA